MSPLSHVCRGVSRVLGAEGGAPRRWRLRGPGTQKACPSSPQRSREGGGCNLMAGHPLPAGRDEAPSTAGLTPHKAAAQPCEATAFLPWPHGAEHGCSGFGRFQTLNQDFSLCERPNTHPTEHRSGGEGSKTQAFKMNPTRCFPAAICSAKGLHQTARPSPHPSPERRLSSCHAWVF